MTSSGKQHSFLTDLDLLLQSAQQGNIDAQATLAMMYDHGHRFSQNSTEAAKWYRKAALQGDALSQYTLAEMYLDGRGLTPSVEKAVYWLRKAARNRLPIACYLLGYLLHMQKKGSARKEAWKWIVKAAESGMAQANIFLGDLFAKGDGVDADKDKAMHHYRIAAEQAYAEMAETAKYAQYGVLSHSGAQLTSHAIPSMGSPV